MYEKRIISYTYRRKDNFCCVSFYLNKHYVFSNTTNKRSAHSNIVKLSSIFHNRIPLEFLRDKFHAFGVNKSTPTQSMTSPHAHALAISNSRAGVKKTADNRGNPPDRLSSSPTPPLQLSPSTSCYVCFASSLRAPTITERLRLT